MSARNLSLLAGGLALSAVLLSAAHAEMLPRTEGEFLGKLHHANQMEIALGNLAKERASSREVRDYGDRLVRDHQNAEREMIEFARNHGISISQPPAVKRAQDKKAMEKLRGLNGSELDRELVSMMVKDHRKVIDQMTAARSRFTDPKLDALLDKMLPVLKEHLEAAENLERVGREKTM
jgi:putative membrane protein